MLKQSSYFIVGILVIIASCVEPYELSDQAATKQKIVIESSVNNQNQPYTTIISQTKSLDQSFGMDRVKNAEVYFENELGEKYYTEEIQPGRYVTDSTKFRGEIGMSYKLVIVLTNGTTFESDHQKILPPDPIRDLSNELTEVVGVDSEGMAVNLVTRIPTTSLSKYHRYSYSADFALETPLQGQDTCYFADKPEPDDPEYPPDTLRCFAKEGFDTPLNIYSTEGLDAGQTIEQDIYTFYYNFKFSIAYNMLLEKQTIDKSAYDYLKKIKEQQENEGSIFDTPPTQILGNIHNKTDSDNPPLGFFIAYSSVKERTVIRPSDFRSIITTENLFKECYPDWIPGVDPERQPKAQTYCCDCRYYPQSTVIEPEYFRY